MGSSDDVRWLETNGQVVIYRNPAGKLCVYDGSKVTEGAEWFGSDLTGTAKGVFYMDSGNSLDRGELSGGAWKNQKKVVADYNKAPLNIDMG